MQKTTLFKNFNIITGANILYGASLIVKDERIDKIGYHHGDDAHYSEIIEGNGEYYLSPGFIDIHVHGGGGFDFMDADPNEYNAIAKHHAKYGTTSFFPTTTAASREELTDSIKAYDIAKTKKGGAKMLGMHLEGPYLAKSQKGAMDEKYIRDPISEEYEELCNLSDEIKRITAAPELPGSYELGNYLYKRGIIPSVGHTDAVCEEIINAYNKGNFRLMTHLYSAMSMTRRIGINRYAGAVEAAYLLDGMYVEIIADGIHLPKELLQLIYKIKGSDRIALITDAMRGSGMQSGKSIIGSRKNGQEVLIEDGVAKLLDKTAFAGSIATTNKLVKTIMEKADVPFIEAIKMMTETPAKIMYVFNDRGSLESGKYADIVVIDEDINVKLTMIEGDIVYSNY